MDNTQKMFNAIFEFPEQLAHAQEIGKSFTVSKIYENANGIVFAGMGGSGIAGELVAATISKDLKIPVAAVKGYSLPNWVNKDTLVILCSYSGNTEETLSCFNDALERNAHIAGITSGGMLQDLLINNNFDCITIPRGLQPRAALGYLSIPLYFYLWKMHFIAVSVLDSVDKIVWALQKIAKKFSKQSDDNEAFVIAKTLQNTIPTFYGDNELTSVVATRWRAQLAENSKMLSSTQVLPEFNHNELEAYKSFDNLENRSIVWLLDPTMHQRNAKRYEICKKIIENVIPVQITVEAQGGSYLERIFYLMYLGDWVSYWLAVLRNVDPMIIPNIDRLKKELQ